MRAIRKKQLTGLLLAAFAVAAVRAGAGLLRWQMLRSLIWKPSPIDPAKPTVVVIDPMIRPLKDYTFLKPACAVADYLEQLAFINIDIIHYSEAGDERVNFSDPVCIIIAGQTAPWSDYEEELMRPVFDFLRETSLPVLGICGGHQLIGQAFDSKVAPMGKKEWGYTRVELLKDDKLFAGLQSPITVFNLHGEELKSLPAGFDKLGTNNNCPLQIIGHRSKPIYGVQFHPELCGNRTESRTILLNFLRIAGLGDCLKAK